MGIPRRAILVFFAAIAFFCESNTADSLLRVLAISAEDSNKVILLNKLSRIYRKRGNLDSAFIFGEQARLVSKKILIGNRKGWPKGETWSLNILGIVSEERGNYEAAMTYYTQALKLNLSLARIADAANNYGNIGIVCWKKGNYSDAIMHYEKASKLKEQLKDSSGIALYRMNIGIVYYSLGDFPNALEQYFFALKIYEQRNQGVEIARLYMNMGILYNSLREYDKCAEYYRKALSIYKVTEPSGYALMLNSLGNLYVDLNQNDSAMFYFSTALKLQQQMGQKNNAAITMFNLGGVYESKKEYSKALEYYLKCERTALEVGDNRTRPYMLAGIGSCLSAMGNVAEAQEYFVKARDLAKQLGEKDALKEISLQLSEFFEKNGHFKGALAEYRNYVELRDSLLGEENTRKTVRMQMQYQFDKKEATLKFGQDKKDAIAAEQISTQKAQRNYFVTGFALVILLSGFILYGFLQKRKANKLLEVKNQLINMQKEMVEEKQKDILDSIAYAQKIQRALIASEKYIDRNLNRLKNRARPTY